MGRIPRRLFLYWAQGFDSAPDVVKIATESWEKFNPELEIIKLDATNVHHWVPEVASTQHISSLDRQKQSDLLRLNILSEHGGFWADATLVCTRPIDEWLNFSPGSGVVFLRTPRGKNRLLQTFFLGAEAGSHFMTTWLHTLEKILLSGAQPMSNATLKRWKSRHPLVWKNALTTALWSSASLVKKTKYPYLLPHYVANRLILTSPRMAAAYLRTPTYRAGEALHYQETGKGLEAFRASLGSEEFPLWKLTWRTNVNPDHWVEVVAAIRDHLEHHAPGKA